MPFLDRALDVLGDIGDNKTNLRQLESCIGLLVPFVGAGLSVEFGYPTWSEFLRNVARRFGKVTQVEDCLAAHQFEEAAEIVSNAYPNRFDDYLRETFDEERVRRPLVATAVRQLARTTSGPVLTTNFDHVLESAFADMNKPFVRVFSGSRIREASRAIQLGQRFLLKLHGDYSDFASRVLTLKEYAREYGSPNPNRVRLGLDLPRILSQALGARPLFFLGCSLQGDRTTLVVARIAKKLPGTVHFALLSEEENVPTRLQQLDRLNIRPLFFPAGKFDKVTQLLACMAEMVSPRLAGSSPVAEVDIASNAELPELTYFSYRDEAVELIDTSTVSHALASRYGCEPVSIGDTAFPVAILWQNEKDVIHPDKILGALDSPAEEPRPLTESATLSEREYASARGFIKAIYESGPIKHESLEYCMTDIDLTGSVPRINGRFGFYYDSILTQYAMEWELKKALKGIGFEALAQGRVGVLPLREAVELARNPLIDGAGRCTALTVSMLVVFERSEQGLWTLIQRRSKAVGVSPSKLHVVPAGMFEVKNRREKWSIQSAIWREMLEEVYDEKEQQGEGVPEFEDYIRRKEPLLFLSRVLQEGRAEFSLTGVCCDLLNLRPEVCTVLLVRDAGLAEIRKMNVNWEYERQGPAGTFGTPWSRIERDILEFKIGETVPSGIACLELGRMWLRQRHGL